MTAERRALLGDHEASKRLSDTGVLLLCPMCRGKARVRSERYYQPVSYTHLDVYKRQIMELSKRRLQKCRQTLQ